MLCREWIINEGNSDQMWSLYSIDGDCHATIKGMFRSRLGRFLGRYLLGCRNYSYRVFKNPGERWKLLYPTGYSHTLEEAKAEVLKRLNAKIATPRLMNLL